MEFKILSSIKLGFCPCPILITFLLLIGFNDLLYFGTKTGNL